MSKFEEFFDYKFGICPYLVKYYGMSHHDFAKLDIFSLYRYKQVLDKDLENIANSKNL